MTLLYFSLEKITKNLKINYLFFLIFLFSNSLEAGKLKINVVNLDQKVGLIHFALYNKPDLFPEKKGKIFGLAKNAKEIFDNGLIIENLEESEYAVAIFHDENSNDKFDTFLAIPQEKYGFSNDAPIFFGPPDFKDAAFFVGDNDFVEIYIKLR